MNELREKIRRISDAYEDFILGVINYAQRRPENVEVLNEYMDTHQNVSASDVVHFIMLQPDFHIYSAVEKMDE